MAFSFVSAGAESNLTAAGTLAPGLPAGYQAGDIFILITVTRAGSALANPSGYTPVDNVTEGTTLSVRVSQKIATSSETAPTFSVTVASRAVILCYRSSLGLGIIVESTATVSNGSGTTLQADNVISTQSTNLVLTVWGTTNVAATLTGNAGYTTRFTGNPTASAMGMLSTDAVRTTVSTTSFAPTSASSSVSLASGNVTFVLRENSTVYWVGSGGTWNTTSATNWSLSSGGTASQSIPKPTDSVVIDSSSGTGTITCSGGNCNNLTVTASQAITLGGTSLGIYGNISTPSGGSFVFGTSIVLNFLAESLGKTITTNGKTFPALTFSGQGGGWILQDTLNMGSRTLTLTRDNLNLNNQNVTCGAFSSSNSNGRTLTMGSGTFTLATNTNPPTTVWNVATSTGFTLNANTSTIVFRQSSDGSEANAPGSVVTFAGGGLTYNNLTFADATSNNVFNPVFAITGANTFNTVASTRTLAYTVQLPSGETTTVSTWSANGLLQNPLTIKSATTGTTGTLAVTNTFTTNYAFVRDINLTVLNRGTVDNGLIVNSANWALGSGSSFGDILTSGTSWTVPSSWTSGNNTVHIFGGGGGGSGGIATTVAGGAGGGGGGYAQLVNYSASPSSVIRYSIGTGGSGGGGTASSSTGISGGTTGFAGTVQTIAFVSQQVSVQNSGSTTITATVPSVSNGNLMILVLNSSNANNTWNIPIGWTRVNAGTFNGRALFWRIASSEPASYVATQSASNTSDAIILVFSNATFDTSGLASQTAVTTIQPVNISVAEANSTIVYVAASSSAVSATFTTPTGYTSRAVDSDATAPSCSVFSLANVAAGTYTAPTTTTSGGGIGRAYVIALSPAIGSFTASATGGSGGSSATGPTSTGGAGGTGSGGSINTTGGTGGAGATASASTMRTGGGGGGAAGPNGNGGNGGAGGGNSATTCGAGGGGGNGGGTAGAAGSSSIRSGGAGGNNSLGTGGGATQTGNSDGNPGIRGGGGSGAADNNHIGGTGGDGLDIAGVIGGGGGSGGGTQVAQTQSAGLYGGGGGGGGVSSGTPGAGGSGAQGAIIITWATTAGTSTGNFFFLFM